MKKIIAVLSVLLMLTGIAALVQAEEYEAVDLTEKCTVSLGNSKSTSKITDKKYTSYQESKKIKNPTLSITSPEDLYGLYLCFRNMPGEYTIQVDRGNGWENFCEGDTRFYHVYYPLDGVRKVRVYVEGDKKQVLAFNEVYVFSEGITPSWVQRWEPLPEKIDILFCVAHPEEELLYLGGAIPYYAVEKNATVGVACLSYANTTRRSELLNGLWSMGYRYYPIIGDFKTASSKSLKAAYKGIDAKNGEKTVVSWFTNLMRRYRPEVVVAPDLNGEGGNGQRMMVADACQKAFSLTADESYDLESAASCGTWQVKKMYLHLYGSDNPKEAIRAYFALAEEMMPIMEYGFLRKETDNADPVAQSIRDRADHLFVNFNTVTSFGEPELLDLPADVLSSIASDPDMADYSEYIRNLVRLKAHSLPKDQERLIAMMGEVSAAPDNIFTALTEADMKFPPVKMPDGTEQELSDGNYLSFIYSKDRDVRSQAFRHMMNTYAGFGNTIASTYGASVKNDQFQANARHYGSARTRAMEPLEIPESVYDQLITVVHENLPVLQDYLSLRKKMLKLDELHHFDLYVPMIDNYEMEMPYEKACDLVLQGLKPLGEDYQALLRKAMADGWIDVYPSKGKSSGAFSSGSLAKVHPYVLLNHTDDLESAFTIAHELGHSMHSYYSNQAQPFPKADYSLFVAEVASTCNEAIMMRHLLSQFPEKDAQAYLLNHFLEQFRTTCFRQTMFAEFELKSHRMAEEGVPLTKEALNKAYFDINNSYYGQTVFMDPEIANEWMRIPHFYRAYYVYVYATGFCVAISLSERILKEGAPAVADYKKFLSAGCSVPPIEALKLAGIDMTGPEPIRSAMSVFKDILKKMHEVTGV